MKRVAAALALALTIPLAACVSAQDPAGANGAAGAAAEPAAPVSGTDYDALIARYAEKNGVPLDLAHAVIKLESGYNARATGRGTIGLMQIKPATAAGIGYRGSAAGLYDPATNLEWGMKYLGGAYELGDGDVCGTALRYQGGHRATRPTGATSRYCAALKAVMADGDGE